ncbi:MAG: tRNA lysidine(34) synthetase TilS [Gemmobacter sp.]
MTTRAEAAVAAAMAGLGRGAAAGVAVSGGGDSVALLDLAARAAPLAGVDLRAVTLDHGLRPAAAREARLVARWARARGIPHTTLRWEGPPPAGNLQAEARAARYRLIGEWARGAGLGAVMLAHTLDDVAETFLMRLGRRAGVEGLAAMAPDFRREGMRWLRPLLGVERAELRDHLRAVGQPWIEDPSNEDTRYGRARVRRVLPALAGAGIAAADLAEVAHHLAEARAALAHHAAETAARIVTEDRGDLIVAREGFAAEPAETRRRILSAALRWISGADHPARGAEIGRFDAALCAGRAATLSGGRRAPAGDTARIGREPRAGAAAVAPPGGIWDGRWRLAGPPAPAGACLRATGAAGLALCPGWRALGLPRASQIAAPALWSAEGTLLAAPLAGRGGPAGAEPWRISASGWRLVHDDGDWRIEARGDIPI